MMKGMIIQQHVIEENMSNLTSASGEASGNSSVNRNGENGENGGLYPQHQQYIITPPPPPQTQTQTQSQPLKRKRNLPGNPDPDAEVISLSPRTLLTTNRFVCEICNKGFQRDQNLQLHRRGHNLPWKLKQRTSKEIKKKVYVCPETSCVHHDPTRALGDLTGIKKHFFRKHGEKKWKCEKCSKRYAVQSDWKAHSKTCGTKEYRCDCGTLFSRRDSFITHRAFCDALAEESARAITGNSNHLFISTSQALPGVSQMNLTQFEQQIPAFNLKKEPQSFGLRPEFPPWLAFPQQHGSSTQMFNIDEHDQYREDEEESENPNGHLLQAYHPMVGSSPHTSATALLQKATQMGVTMSNSKNGSGCSGSGAPTMLLQQGGPHIQSHVSSDFSLDLSSREEVASGFVVNNLASYGNKAAHVAEVAHGTAGTSTTLQEMMTSLSSSSGFDGSTFEDAFGGFLNPNKKHETHLHSGGGNDGMTRDFLGLRPLSHTEIFNITGLDNCMNKSSNDYQNQNQKPWQG